MDKKKRIEVNSSSLVGLKAELYRKQEEFRREKLEQVSGPTQLVSLSKKNSIWQKKKKKQGSGGSQATRKDAEELEKERAEMERSRSMLEAKAKLYEQMTSGNTIPDEQTNSLFLVDFERKQLDKREPTGGDGREEDEKDILAPDSEIAPPSNPDDQWVDYTDTLGRSRRCMKKDLPGLMKMDKNLNPDKFKDESADMKDDSETIPEMMSDDMHRERMRKKWEQEQEELLDSGQTSIHYQNVRFDEVRSHGTAYFEFAKDEGTREKQMDTLKYLREETVDKRTKREELKAKRKAALEARLEKVRKRKKIQTGVAEGPEEGLSKGLEGTELVQEKPEAEVDPNWQRTLRLVEAAKKESLKEDRDWDVGKEPKAWADQRKMLQNERPDEFAPPTNYTPIGKKTGRCNKQWRSGGHTGVETKRGNAKTSYGIKNGDQSLFTETDSFSGGGSNSESNPGEQRIMGEWEQQRNKVQYDGSSAPSGSKQGHMDWDRNRDGDNRTGDFLTKQHDSHAALDLNTSSVQIKYKNNEYSTSSEIHPSAENDGQRGRRDDIGQSSSHDATETESKDAASDHKPTPLIRTVNTKPIKFSIGSGNRKNEKAQPLAENVLDVDDDIKKTISFFRKQAN